jgi:chemosensory pili system protein ChpA (sensor histidine kinase/response regulator)
MDDGEKEFLRSIFLMEAWDMIAVIEDRAQELLATKGAVIDPEEPLLMLTHTLRGTAAVQGVAGIAALAAGLEAELDGVVGKPTRSLRRVLRGVSPWLATVKGALDALTATAPVTLPPMAPPAPTPDAPTSGQLADVFVESPEIVEYFAPEAAEHLEAMTQSLLRLEQQGPSDEEVDTLLRAAHTLKGAAFTVGHRPIGELAHRLEDLMVAVREHRTPLDAAVIDTVLAGTDALKLLLADDPPAAAVVAAAVQATTDRVVAILGGVAAPAAPADDASLPAPAVAEGVSWNRLGPAALPSTSEPPAGRASIRVALARLDALMNLVGELVTARSRFDGRLTELDRVGELLELSRERLVLTVGEFEGKYEYSRLPQAPAAATADGEFGELEFDRYDDWNVLARTMAELATDVSEVRAELARLLRTVRDDADGIRRLTGELRREITRARMVPIGALFARFGRQVRDAGRTVGKQVVLATSGEDVELDNTIVELIADPLLHLVQNAVWHGIENPEARLAAGKPPQATVSLAARHQGSSIHVEVEDDGWGIDVEKVKRLAVDKGLLGEAAAATLSEREAIEFLFLPGFSTAATVTTAAGRGVGLDVVRTNLRRLGGEIDVDTERGVGTRFMLKLPLTVVVSDALMIRVGTETLAVPLTAVRRVLSVDPADLQGQGAGERVEADGELVEVVRLGERLQLATSRPAGPMPVLLLRAAGRTMAVVVDELLRKEEVVIKGLSTFLDGVGPFGGTTIGGDGRVILVLDATQLGGAADALRGPVAGPATWPPVSPPSIAARAGVVLLVDDSVSVRRFVGSMLQRAGFEVHTANDGAEALERLGELTVDVVVTDLEMPRLNGYELVEALSRRPATRHLPVIVLTTRAGEKHVERARRLGVKHYMTKPVDTDAFLALVRSLVVARPPAPADPLS